MTEQELADLLGRAGIRPAWQGTREARPGYQQQQSPAGALADPRTVPYRRVPTRRDREFSRASLADTTQRGAFSEPRNQFAEAGMNVLETTGAPEIARGVQSIQRNQPGEAAGHFSMGALGLLGTATLPFGSGARAAPPRVPRIQQAMPEAQGIPNAPPRLPGRATDGSILPLRPREPIRQSLVGGSDDLREAAGMRPAGGGRVQAYRGSVVPYEGNNGIQFWSADPDIASSNAFGEGANVTRADLDLGRTLEVDGRLRPWDDLDPEGISDEALRREFAQRVHTMDPSAPTGAYGWFDVRTTDRLGQLARRHGYDSVTLRNVIEGGAPLENGTPRPTTTYAIAGDRARFAAPEAPRTTPDAGPPRPPPMFPGGRNR